MGNKKEDLEFGGAKGVTWTLVLMPVLTYSLNIYCYQYSTESWLSLAKACLDPAAFALYFVYLMWHVLLHLSLPGNRCYGTRLATGERLRYNMNGFSCLLATLFAFFALYYTGIPVNKVHTKILGLVTAGTVYSILTSTACYYLSFLAPESQLCLHGNTGIPVYDFYLGRELNPRIGDFDIKFFLELRPGLVGFLLLDLTFIAEFYAENNYLNDTMICLVVFHAIYVVDALCYEESVLTTFDITTEGFGFMLCFGNLTYVPFIFSLQTRYLLYNPVHWSRGALIFLFIINAIGYWIFRTANNEKDIFKRLSSTPDFQALLMSRWRNKAISSEDGKQTLLYGGWWRICRHPNYLGDIIMAYTWGVTCGFQSPLPWFYVLYLTATLVHRSERNDKICAAKYGDLWNQYCRLVQYRILPRIL